MIQILNGHNKKVDLLVELVIVGIVFLALREVFSVVKYASQIAEVVCLLLITYLLKRRQTTWADLGIRRPKNWLLALLYFVLCVVSIGLIFNFVVQPLFPEGANDIDNGASLSLNEMLFQLFFIGILAAAIGEEMLFRGFLLNNINEIFGKNFIGTTVAILLQALIFGLLHSGVQGMVSAGVIGLILGAFYLIAGRNLLVVMAAHAVPDILSIISSYQSQ